MARIQFRAKPEQVFHMDGALAYERIRVPVLTRSHCDMAAFRGHAKWGGFANSGLFPTILTRIRKQVFGGDYIRLDSLPDGVAVDTSGFLAVVSADV